MQSPVMGHEIAADMPKVGSAYPIFTWKILRKIFRLAQPTSLNNSSGHGNL